MSCVKIAETMAITEQKTFFRGVDPSPLLIKTSAGIESVDYCYLLEKFGVDEIIRIPQIDYPELALRGETFVHYNLPIMHDRLGWEVIMCRIVEAGCRKSPKEERKPLLSLEDVWKARVVDFYQREKYSDIPREIFLEKCIGRAKNKSELERMMVKRYQPVYPFLKEDQILREGVTVTMLKLIEKVTYQG